MHDAAALRYSNTTTKQDGVWCFQSVSKMKWIELNWIDLIKQLVIRACCSNNQDQYDSFVENCVTLHFNFRTVTFYKRFLYIKLEMFIVMWQKAKWRSNWLGK